MRPGGLTGSGRRHVEAVLIRSGRRNHGDGGLCL